MIATAPQPLQSNPVDTPTYVEIVKAILTEALHAQGLDVDEMDD